MTLNSAKRQSLAFLAAFWLATASHAEPYPGFHFVQHNGVDPVIKGDEVHVEIHDQECSKKDYGDGRDEDDCRNGNVTSYLIKAYHAKPGDTFDYHMEVKIGGGIAYPGYVQNGEWDSRLRMFAFLRDAPKNHIYEMKLDSKRGATFMGSVCFSADQFGKWNTLDLRVHWAKDATGSVQLTCNGKLVYSAENVVTTLSPQCIVTNHCILEEQERNQKIHFSFGLRMDGFGREWKMHGKKSQFTEIQPEGISATYRNVSARRVKN